MSHPGALVPKATFANLAPDKRARVLEAAIDEFASRPYAVASLDRVVERAGISKGSLYQYFDSKLDLYRWLLGEHLPARKLEAIGQQGLPPTGTVWDVLEAAVRAGVAFAVAEPKLNRLGVRFLRDHQSEPELAAIAAGHRAAGDRWLQALLQQGQARGEVRQDLDLGTLSGMLGYALGEGMLDPIARRLGLSLAELLDAPEQIGRLTEDDRTALGRSVTDLFRRGAAPSGEER